MILSLKFDPLTTQFKVILDSRSASTVLGYNWPLNCFRMPRIMSQAMAMGFDISGFHRVI